MEILTVVLPIFTVIGLGFVLRHFNVIKLSWIQVLNNFVYYIALPALVINSQLSLDLGDPTIVHVIGWNWLWLTVAALVCFVVVKLLPITNELRGGVYLTSIVGSTVYMGIPMVTGVLHLSQTDPQYASVVLIGTMQLMWVIVLTLVGVEFMTTKRFNPRHVVKVLSKNPILWSLVAGLVVSLAHNSPQINSYLRPTLSMIAATASPIALLTLGAFMRSAQHRVHAGMLVFVSAYKLVLLPLVAWLFMSFASVPASMKHASVIYAGMPVAVTAFILSQKYKIHPSFVATALLVTTVGSFLTLSFLVAVK